MKNFFHIETRQQDNGLHIKLQGTFDGASAFALLNCIEPNYDANQPVFIDTKELTEIFPFGKTILHAQLPKNQYRKNLIFSGTRASQIAPEGCHTLETSNH